MAIVKEKVTEYQNGQYSRSYTQINIPASVAKSVGEATNVIGEAYAKAMLDKQNHIENMYHRMNDNITFLSNFKDLNSDFSKTVSYFEDKIKNTFDSFYKIDKKNEIVFSNKTMDKINNRILITFLISILVTIIGGVIDNALIYKPAAIMTVISLGMGFLYLAYGFVVYIPSSLKKARIKFEELENEIDKSNLFDLSIELGKIVNFFNSDEQKVKVYNKEISQDEYESNIVNALKEAIKINFSSTLNKNIIDEQTSKYTEFEKIKEEANKKEIENQENLKLAQENGFDTYKEYTKYLKLAQDNGFNSINEYNLFLKEKEQKEKEQKEKEKIELAKKYEKQLQNDKKNPLVNFLKRYIISFIITFLMIYLFLFIDKDYEFFKYINDYLSNPRVFIVPAVVGVFLTLIFYVFSWVKNKLKQKKLNKLLEK